MRYQEIEEAYPNYFLKLNDLFRQITSDSKNDAKLVQQDYIQNKVKKTKIKLKIFIKKAVNLVAKDSNGNVYIFFVFNVFECRFIDLTYFIRTFNAFPSFY